MNNLSIDLIEKYFAHELTKVQKEQFKQIGTLYPEWNSKINVISRKDIDNLYLHHILHSLSIAKYIHFQPDTTIIDVGTGGGFPGIPLAIFFPEVKFVLLDSIGKKVKVAQEIATAINLQNVECVHKRIEEEKRKFHFVLSRAVMPLPDLVKLSRKNVSLEHKNAMPNGIICLKGGELASEMSPFKNKVEAFPLTKYFSEDFFATKKLIYLPIH